MGAPRTARCRVCDEGDGDRGAAEAIRNLKPDNGRVLVFPESVSKLIISVYISLCSLNNWLQAD